MKSLRLRLHPDAEAIHPMHEFVARREGFSRSRLLVSGERHEGTDAGDGGGDEDRDEVGDGNGDDGTARASLFHVEGPNPEREPYAAALRDTDGVVDFELDRRGDVLYLYVLEQRSPFDARLAATFGRLRLVVVPPVDFVADRTIRLTVVGSAEAVTSAVEALPEGVDSEVRRVGGFDGTVVDPSPSAALTARQREAIEAAVAVGYYGATREGGVDDVADRLGCATGTAAEHLRKAEARVMRGVIGER